MKKLSFINQFFFKASISLGWYYACVFLLFGIMFENVTIRFVSVIIHMILMAFNVFAYCLNNLSAANPKRDE